MMMSYRTLVSLVLLIGFHCSASAKGLMNGTPVDHQKGGILQIVTLAQWQTIRQSYVPNILVVDLWATWCSSCLERFPKMVSLSIKYADKPIQFVSLNLDDRDDAPALVLAKRFLHKHDVPFPNFHLNENLMKAFDALHLQSIPAVIIYDAKGQERYRLTGDDPNKQYTDQDVESAIVELLTKP